MITFRTPRLSTLLAVCGLLLLAACDDAIETTGADLSEADVALAAEIAAQALSDADEGTMADLNDLNASVGDTDLGYGDGPVAQRAGAFADRAWRQPNKRYLAVYDSATGEHTVAYQRTFTSPRYSKELTVQFVYVFTDADGNFIARPRADARAIDAIAFHGQRSGFTRAERPNGGSRESRFAREARWEATDVQSGIVAFVGAQQDKGIFRAERGDTTVERTYEATFRTENVTLTRANARDGIEAAVTGQIVYAITMQHTGPGGSMEKTVEGTIELEGNGKALLRFLGTRQIYRVDLKNGDVQRG